jgi:hypothetical protein
LSARLNDPDRSVRALGFRGFARVRLGDADGLHDLQALLDSAVAAGEGRVRAVIYNNLAHMEKYVREPQVALDRLTTGIEFAVERGLVAEEAFMRGARLQFLFELGRWQELLDDAVLVDARSSFRRTGIGETDIFTNVELRR